jgi:hypothetical protein
VTAASIPIKSIYATRQSGAAFPGNGALSRHTALISTILQGAHHYWAIGGSSGGGGAAGLLN